jgi:DUF4097 and DUF4098 domain-containing protein YvlB
MVVKTSNNSVSMVDVGGNLDIVTSNGGVKVRTTKVLKNVNITTSTGKIDYQSITDATGKYILHTTNNAIEMFLKRDSKLSFYAETSNGIISCDLPVTDTNPDQQILEGNLNAGGAEVNVKTSNGNINIHDDSK